jgi:hypothetical protein
VDATLSLSSAELNSEDLHDLTQDLCRTLNEETEIEAAIREGSPKAGSKGDPMTLGTLALSFLTGGSAVALIKVLGIYFSRKESLDVTLERNDGSKMKIRAENVRPEQIERTSNLAREFFGGG